MPEVRNQNHRTPDDDERRSECGIWNAAMWNLRTEDGKDL